MIADDDPKCPECGTIIHHHDDEECCSCFDCPECVTGSCDDCGVNLDGNERYEGLCDQCSWARTQG